jgi:hypothetical protein
MEQLLTAVKTGPEAPLITYAIAPGAPRVTTRKWPK